jgi:hypothetical protein
MAMASMAMPMMKGATSLISSAAGGKGGSSSTAGGVSPQEAALAQYTMGQSILHNNAAFAHSGTGASTMNTYANTGPQFQAALTMAGMADQNAAAQQQVNQSQQAPLDQLAQSAGFGSTGGNFGNTGGNLGSTPVVS